MKRNGFKTQLLTERASVCPISDKHNPNFNIWTTCMALAETAFFCTEKNKELDVICISNCLLLDRFRLGVKREEIPPFKLIVEDIGYDPINNDCTFEDVCKTGDLCETWDSEILNTRISIIMELI